MSPNLQNWRDANGHKFGCSHFCEVKSTELRDIVPHHQCDCHLVSPPNGSLCETEEASHSLTDARPITRRTIKEFFEDSIPTVAGGITFFFLLALFPALASIVSLFGFFADRKELLRDLELLTGFLPGGAVAVLRDELLRLSKQTVEMNLAMIGSTVVALWSASGGYRALIEGLNVAYELKETRSFLRLCLNALAFTALAIIGAAVALNFGLVLPYWMETNTKTLFGAMSVHILVWLGSFGGLSLVIALIYKVGPNHPTWDAPWIT